MNANRNRGSEVWKYKKWVKRQVQCKIHAQQSLHDEIQFRYTQIIGVVSGVDLELICAATIRQVHTPFIRHLQHKTTTYSTLHSVIHHLLFPPRGQKSYAHVRS